MHPPSPPRPRSCRALECARCYVPSCRSEGRSSSYLDCNKHLRSSDDLAPFLQFQQADVARLYATVHRNASWLAQQINSQGREALRSREGLPLKHQSFTTDPCSHGTNANRQPCTHFSLHPVYISASHFLFGECRKSPCSFRDPTL